MKISPKCETCGWVLTSFTSLKVYRNLYIMKQSFWDISKSSNSAQPQWKFWTVRYMQFFCSFFSTVIPTGTVSVSFQHEITSDNTALWKADKMRTFKWEWIRNYPHSSSRVKNMKLTNVLHTEGVYKEFSTPASYSSQRLLVLESVRQQMVKLAMIDLWFEAKPTV